VVLMGSSDEATRRERYEALFRSHSRPILGYALRRLERPEDAADALAEVMLVAWRRLDEVPAEPETRLWLFGVARGVIRNASRSTVRRGRLGERLRAEVATTWQRDHADAWAEHDAVRSAVRRLGDDDREVLLLTAWEGLEPSEIAKVLDVPPATVRTRLHRALGRLEAELAVGERSGRSGHVGDGGPVLGRYIEEEA
jgi:RNA polymerase sigma factor (sigma-70 family)